MTVPSGTLALALPRPSKEAGAGDVELLALNALPAPGAGALALCLHCVSPMAWIYVYIAILSHICSETQQAPALFQRWLLVVLYPLYSSASDPPGTFSPFDSSLN